MKHNQVENIRTDRFIKRFQVGENQCEFVVEDAFYGEWNGKSEVLDEEILVAMGEGAGDNSIKAYDKIQSTPFKNCYIA